MNGKSLRDRILVAKSKAELEALLAEGETYEFASVVTKRRWEKAARRRVAELARQADKADEQTTEAIRQGQIEQDKEQSDETSK